MVGNTHTETPLTTHLIVSVQVEVALLAGATSSTLDIVLVMEVIAFHEEIAIREFISFFFFFLSVHHHAEIHVHTQHR